jgi:hypothetical protein
MKGERIKKRKKKENNSGRLERHHRSSTSKPKKNKGFTEMISKSPRKTIFGDQ